MKSKEKEKIMIKTPSRKIEEYDEDGFRHDIPRCNLELEADQDNPSIAGVQDGRTPISKLSNGILHKLQGFKTSYFSGQNIDHQVTNQVKSYEEFLNNCKNINPSEVNFDWRVRFNSMVNIIHGNRKAGFYHIRNQTYNLVNKLILNDLENLARCLDLEYEIASHENYDYIIKENEKLKEDISGYF